MHPMILVKRAGALRRAVAALAVLPVALACHAQDPATTSAAPAEASAGDAATSPTNGRISLVRSNMPAERILGEIASKTGVNIAARGKVAGTKLPAVFIRDATVRDALNQIVNSQPNWLLYEPADSPGTFEVWDMETYRTEVLPRLVRPKTFVPREITAEEAHKAISGILTPNIGTAAFDPRSNKVFVTDLVPVLELAQRLIEQIDIKFITRVFYIQHADINAISEKLSNLKSPAAPPVEVDERTRQIIVRDRLDILRQMELLVETLDIGPEMRVYDINNLGIDGDELTEIEEAVTEIITPDAFLKFNIRQGRMLLRDVQEAHERVEKVLAAFDQPIKQVLVQAEIIETEFADGFNYAIDYAFSGDLFSSVIDGLTGRVPGSGTGAGAVPASTGLVPTGSGPLDPTTLGFINFRKEFPIVQGGSTGINAQFLTRHAYVRLQAAMSDSRTRVLQQPRILVANQKTAIFNVGQKIPFFTGGSIGTTQSGGTNTLTPSQPVQQLLTVGLDLELTPIISNNGLIELEVIIRNNTPLRSELRFNGAIFDGVGSNNQELETTLLIPSGETRVVGGLIADAKSETRSGIPGLMKIPVIGPALFGSYTRNPDENRRRNLLIFLTPTIVQEKAGDLIKYKGRVVADAADEFTTPTSTLSDIQCDPVPMELPLPPDKTSYAPPPLDYGSSTDVPPVLLPPLDSEVPREQTEVESETRTVIQSESVSETEATSLDSAVSQPGAVELKKIKIKENANTDTTRAMLPRVPSPSGSLTGVTGATGGAAATGAVATGAAGTTAGQPAGAGRTAAGAVAGTPPVIQPGANTTVVMPGAPAGATPAAAATTQPTAPTPPITSTPPPPETKVQ